MFKVIFLTTVLFLPLHLQASEEASDLDSEFTKEEIQSLKDRTKKSEDTKKTTSRLDKMKEAEEILERGEVSTVENVFGGAAALVVGFGLGHAIERNWLSKGWIFTASEIGLLTIALSVNDYSPGVFGRGNFGITGVCMLGFIGMKLWEIFDAWIEPSIHNEKYLKLRERLNSKSTSFFIIPTAPNSQVGLTMGISL